ncbi:MAG: hypothetical protein HC794_08135 [Nitrospiraceae bacterium]|nr:hypothetical protein [Nitrospiraceae bacterium]
MAAADIVLWSLTVLAVFAGVAAVAIAYLAAIRWLVAIVPAIVLVGFAFEPATQVRFTAALLGMLAILYLPPLVVAWVWRQIARLRPSRLGTIMPPSAREMAAQDFTDEMARDLAKQQVKVITNAREHEDPMARARDLERQGAFSLWSRP